MSDARTIIRDEFDEPSPFPGGFAPSPESRSSILTANNTNSPSKNTTPKSGDTTFTDITISPPPTDDPSLAAAEAKPDPPAPKQSRPSIAPPRYSFLPRQPMDMEEIPEEAVAPVEEKEETISVASGTFSDGGFEIVLDTEKENARAPVEEEVAQENPFVSSPADADAPLEPHGLVEGDANNNKTEPGASTVVTLPFENKNSPRLDASEAGGCLVTETILESEFVRSESNGNLEISAPADGLLVEDAPADDAKGGLAVETKVEQPALAAPERAMQDAPEAMVDSMVALLDGAVVPRSEPDGLLAEGAPEQDTNVPDQRLVEPNAANGGVVWNIAGLSLNALWYTFVLALDLTFRFLFRFIAYTCGFGPHLPFGVACRFLFNGVAALFNGVGALFDFGRHAILEAARGNGGGSDGLHNDKNENNDDATDHDSDLGETSIYSPQTAETFLKAANNDEKHQEMLELCRLQLENAQGEEKEEGEEEEEEEAN